MVENEGRISYGDINDPKGLVSNVTLDEKIVPNWVMLHVDLQPSDFRQSNNLINKVGEEITGFFKGKVPRMPDGKPPQDTYLLIKGWTKVCIKLTLFKKKTKICLQMHGITFIIKIFKKLIKNISGSSFLK